MPKRQMELFDLPRRRNPERIRWDALTDRQQQLINRLSLDDDAAMTRRDCASLRALIRDGLVLANVGQPARYRLTKLGSNLRLISN